MGIKEYVSPSPVPAGLIKVPLFSVLPFQNSQKNGRLVLGEDISIFSMQFAETQVFTVSLPFVIHQKSSGPRSMSAAISLLLYDFLCSLFAPLKDRTCICINLKIILPLLVDDVSLVFVYAVIVVKLYPHIFLCSAGYSLKSN